MKYFSLVWGGLWRSKMRTSLTMLSAVIAFLLFGVLQGVDATIGHIIANAHLDRLITVNAAYVPLPMSYLPQIKAIPGVTDATYLAGFGGYYKKPENGMGGFATDLDSFLRLIPDYGVSPAEKAAMAQNRTGALATTTLAQRFGWKVGDTIFLHASPAQKNGSFDWQFHILGFFDVQNQPDAQIFVFNYDYLDKGRSSGEGTVTYYITHIANPARSGAVATAIDNLFVNSPVQTKTQNEKDFSQSQLSKVGNIEFFLDAIMAAVFFTLLLLVGNALMQSFRERIREFAVMKTLGFSDGLVASLVIAEAILLCLAAAVIGLALASGPIPMFLRAMASPVVPRPPVIVLIEGAGLAILVGLICGAVPAWKARRLAIIDALATH